MMKMNFSFSKFQYDKKRRYILGIAVVLLVCVFSFCFRPNKTIVSAANQIVLLTDNVRNFYKNKPNAWGLNTYSAIQNKIAPQNMVYGRQIRNALNKDVLLGSDLLGNTVMPGSKTFAIVYKNLNQEECIKLSSTVFSDKTMLSFDMISIINSKTYNFSWGAKNALPITEIAAKEICKEDNDILWNIFI